VVLCSLFLKSEQSQYSARDETLIKIKLLFKVSNINNMYGLLTAAWVFCVNEKNSEVRKRCTMLSVFKLLHCFLLGLTIFSIPKRRKLFKRLILCQVDFKTLCKREKWAYSQSTARYFIIRQVRCFVNDLFAKAHAKGYWVKEKRRVCAGEEHCAEVQTKGCIFPSCLWGSCVMISWVNVNRKMPPEGWVAVIFSFF